MIINKIKWSYITLQHNQIEVLEILEGPVRRIKLNRTADKISIKS